MQALKALGKEQITAEVIDKARAQLDPKLFEKILKDTQGATGWIYEAIKQICRVEHG